MGQRAGARGPLLRSIRSLLLTALAGLVLVGLPAAGDGSVPLWQRAPAGRAVCSPPRAEPRRPRSRCSAGAAAAGAVVISKPDLDKRQYRHITLTNGLDVLLASDPEADDAAASLSIKTGSFDDPPEYLGLAHFHEHMLFLGTEKYPDEDEYENFLRDHGGYSNAYTADEITNYYFRVNAPHLPGALDRFAQFFIAPTFDPSALDREMHAVDSESTNYAADEFWRRIQVLKATADVHHPFHRFSVGNLKTLGHSGEAAVREALLHWNAGSYHAGAMRLAVVGREPLDELEASVQRLFGGVRAEPAEPLPAREEEAEVTQPPWTDAQLGAYLEVVPKIEERSVSVSWPLPPTTKHLYGKLEVYISHLLGHEGEGSLHALLNEDGLIEELSAGTSYAFDDAQLLAVDISLTQEGERRVGEVLDRVFAYVAVLREEGPRAETFEELRLLNEIGFRFLEESPAPENAMAAASANLHEYPPRDALRGPNALEDWLPEELSEWLAQLTPRRCLVVQASPTFAEAAEAAEGGWAAEHWYGALFRKRPLSEEEIGRWTRPPASARAGLALPPDNPFVPRDFSLRCDDASATAPTEQPKTALDVTPPSDLSASAGEPELLRLWFKTDSTFRVPRAHISAHIMTPVYSMGPAAVVMLRLFCALLSDDLNTYAYSASMAGLSYSVQFSDRFTFAVAGFSDKLPELLRRVTGRVSSLLRELAEAANVEEGPGSDAAAARRVYWAERLEKQRELLLRTYENHFREDPMEVVVYHMRQLLMADMWHISEYTDVLRKTEGAGLLRPLTELVEAALSKIRIEVLAHGNVAANEAADIAKAISSSLAGRGTPCPTAELPQNPVIYLPPEPDGMVVFDYDLEAENPVEENSAIQNVYQVGPSGEDLQRDACLHILAQLADTSAFQQLRTKEQLGYTVAAGQHQLYGMDGLSVAVQGPRLAPAGMDGRIEAWLGQFRGELEAMSEETFADNVQAAVHTRSQRDKQLAQEAGRHWDEILRRTYRFGKLRAEVAALRQVTKEGVLALFDRHLAAGSPLRRKFSSRVTGASARAAAAQHGEAEAGEGREEGAGKPVRALRTLEEVRAFKEGLPTHSEG